MEKRVNEVLKCEELYFTNEEVIQMMQEFKRKQIWNLINFHPENSWKPKLQELGVEIKELSKAFFDSTFDLNYDLYKESINKEVIDSNAFELDVIESDETPHIKKISYFNDDEQKRFRTSFGNIYINDNDDILSCVEYVHELGHALVERHNKDLSNINSELIAILLEFCFAYDIEIDKRNYIPITNSFYVNKFNPSSVMTLENGEEEFNLSLTKEVINNRLCEILYIGSQFKNETDINKLVDFSSYIKSTIDAINIFESCLDGNICVLAYLDDVLAGRRNVDNFIESCNEKITKIKGK